MEYDRGDSFPSDFEPNGIPFSSKSKEWTVTITIFIGYFPTNDMQTPPLDFDLVFMDNAQCAETNEK